MGQWPDGLRPDANGFKHKTALSEDQLTTDSQRERRVRILDAAVDAAGADGYDLLHMREVADCAGVSVGTLYHYFPSKVHLLVTALGRELIRFDDCLSQDLSGSDGPFAKLRTAIWRLINAMEGSHRVTEALTRAYVASNIVASVEAEMIRVQTSEMFAHLMSDGVAADLHRHSADLLTDVWTSEILALVQGRRTYAQMHRRLTTAIDLVARGAQK